MRGRPEAQTIDEYLKGLSDDKRGALERLRKISRAAAEWGLTAVGRGPK